MFELESKELVISNELNRKIEMICKFACVKYELILGSIISVNNTKDELANIVQVSTTCGSLIPIPQ